jgi:hypothetical protein
MLFRGQPEDGGHRPRQAYGSRLKRHESLSKRKELRKALLAVALVGFALFAVFYLPVVPIPAESHVCGLPPSPNGCGCDGYSESISEWLIGIGYRPLVACYVP